MRTIFSHIKWIAVFAICTRLFGVLTCGDPADAFHRIAEGKLKEQLGMILCVNNDELLIAEVSLNFCHGLGFTSTENRRTGYRVDFTAYRPTYPVYLHILGMKLYSGLFGPVEITRDKSDRYFVIYAFLLHAISLGLYIVSIFYFLIVARYFLNEWQSGVALFFYGIHPAVIFYVGNFANYESITTSLLIICMAIMIKASSEKISVMDLVLLVTCFSISVLFRPQLNFIFLVLFGVSLLNGFFLRKKGSFLFPQSIKLVLTCFVVFIVLNIPVLIKNYRLFGGLTLATTGFNFHQGHNPFAKGSWDGFAGFPESPYYKYVRERIPGYNEMDEFQKSHHIQKLAIDWIVKNPWAEVMLTFRKLAIYFLPENSDHNKFNPINLVFHLGAIACCACLFFQWLVRKKFSGKGFLLAAPLFGSILVTIIFHVGYRWRYYAEPFMVIMTVLVIAELLKKGDKAKKQQV